MSTDYAHGSDEIHVITNGCQIYTFYLRHQSRVLR